MRNELFVTAGEVAQELGVSKPFAYKLVRQMNGPMSILWTKKPKDYAAFLSSSSSFC